MIIKIKTKEIREKKGISIKRLEEDTGIERHRISKIENNKIPVDKISLVEMILISYGLGISILDTYEVTHIEIKGIGEF